MFTALVLLPELDAFLVVEVDEVSELLIFLFLIVTAVVDSDFFDIDYLKGKNILVSFTIGFRKK